MSYSIPNLKTTEKNICTVIEDDNIMEEMKLNMSMERVVMRERTAVLQNHLMQSEHKTQQIQENNISLESRLTKSEPRNQSLEQEVRRLTTDLRQKVQSVESENKCLTNLVSELQDRLKIATLECNELNSENQKLKTELEEFQCKELEPKNNELQQELDSLKKI